ncbi:MAG: LicD family protein [Clostridia bacterium]|nr:LicD family protein [Clostridia bacterium]
MDNTLLKDLQKVELEILLEVDRVCKKHNIKYFLVSGTLLGAIRHKGFIPWDDDIDICMPIKDYRKFCKVCKKELDKKYFLQNYETDLTSMLFTKIRKNGTTAIEESREHRPYHQGVWIDIFPLIAIKNDDKWIKRVTKTVLFAKKILKKKFDWIEEHNKLSFLKKMHRLIPLSFVRFFVGMILKTVCKDHKKYDSCYYIWSKKNFYARFKSDLFDDITKTEFEGYMLPVPSKWREYLTVVYGDYMKLPPVEKRNGGCHTISIIDLNTDYKNYTK